MSTQILKGNPMSDEPHPPAQAKAEPLPHRYRMPDAEVVASAQPPDDHRHHRAQIEPWLSAIFQSEHLSLLLGRGFTLGVGSACRAAASDTFKVDLASEFSKIVDAAAQASAQRLERGEPNFEDQLRSASELAAGLEVLGDARAGALRAAISGALQRLLVDVLEVESEIGTRLNAIDAGDTNGYDALGSFLLSFAARSASRERLHVFTTNYDRVIEYGCERVGLRVLDRFVGTLSPVFRSSRLEVDFHYNPPGIRGEPRFLEGVVRMTKLHGSADWRFLDKRVRRVGLPFGAAKDHPEAIVQPGMVSAIYPNASKDVETSEFPYSELFRDFSAAACRPNSVLVTYGYGFGDSHINSAILDMLTIPSTHLVVISFDEAAGRIDEFIATAGHDAQISYLVGSHFGDLATLIRYYLPKPAIDRITARRARLVQARDATARAVKAPGADDWDGEAE
jgi:hypothetical protein